MIIKSQVCALELNEIYARTMPSILSWEVNKICVRGGFFSVPIYEGGTNEVEDVNTDAIRFTATHSILYNNC